MGYADLPFAYETRIGGRIETVRPTLEKMTVESRKALDVVFRLGFDEWQGWQEVQAQLCASGRLDADEAYVIHTVLGEDPEQYNQEPLEVRIAVTQAMAVFLGRFREELESRA